MPHLKLPGRVLRRIRTIDPYYNEPFILTDKVLGESRDAWTRSVSRNQVRSIFKADGEYVQVKVTNRYHTTAKATLHHGYYGASVGSVRPGILSIGCKSFDAKTTAVIRRWAFPRKRRKSK
jgi:hypothetical protein